MSLDRFIKFDKKKPTKKQLQFLLTDYLNGIGTIDFQKKCWFATLPGLPSFPFRRVATAKGFGKTHQEALDQFKDRWFEVYVGQLSSKKDPNIDVITRQADEFTVVVADGFAELVRRYWVGRVEP